MLYFLLFLIRRRLSFFKDISCFYFADELCMGIILVQLNCFARAVSSDLKLFIDDIFAEKHVRLNFIFEQILHREGNSYGLGTIHASSPRTPITTNGTTCTTE